MKKTNFTFVKNFLWTAMSLMTVFMVNTVQAQSCTLACNDAVNISVSATPANPNSCDVEISADMILENYEDALLNCVAADADFTLTLSSGPLELASGPSALTVAGSDYSLNQSYTIRVEGGGNACWGTVVIEDKAAPTISVCDDETINCTQSVDIVTLPTAEDNCTGATIQLIDESTNDADQCGAGVVITRTYVAIDGQGNTSEPCVQQITIERVQGVDFPEDIAWYCSTYGNNNNITDATALTCTGYVVNPALGNVLDATAETGACLASTGSGAPSIAAGLYCNYATSSSDDVLTICEGADNTFKIIRTWTVLDWCSNSVINFNDVNMNGVQDAGEEDNIQIIKVIDNVAPSITLAATANLELSASQPATATQACSSRSFLPTPTVVDACGTATLQVFTTIGQASLVGGSYQIPAPGLGIGDHVITYVATDACGNSDEIEVTVTVADDVSPTPVCDEITQVSIGANGVATVLAATFDDGSNDNCGIESMAVRRMTDACSISGNTSFGPSVDFCCNDIGTEVVVAFQVTDFFGNTNQCMVNVLVEDNLAPFRVENVTDSSIACENYFTNFAPALDVAEANGDTNPAVLVNTFGDVTYDDNCAAVVTTSWSRDVNSCGVGTITRSWSVTDANGNVGQSSSQTIDVSHTNDWNIRFPADVSFVCTPDMDELDGQNLGEPTIFDDDCELIAVSVESVVYNTVPDACYRVLRTFTAINWCVYDGDNQNDDVVIGTRRFRDGGDGIVTYQQDVIVTDDVAPVITNPGTQTYVINGLTDADGDCDRNIELPTIVVNDCSETVTTTQSLSGVTGTSFNNVGPGTYTVTVSSMDNCGNQSTIEYSIVVRDDKAPTPYCVGGLVAELMAVDTDGDGVSDAGMLELWASDFDAGSFDNCTAQGDLTLTANIGEDNFDTSTTNIDFTCATAGIQNVYLYIQDEAGNVDYCLTTINIESVQNVCIDDENESPEIAGAIHTENNAAINGAMVEVNGGMVSTDETGAFTLTVEAGTDVTVAPSYDTAAADAGVTTFDLLQIRKHILSTELLTSPYKMIAADANNNGSITAADLVVIRTVVLGLSQSFANNTNWIFVDAAYEFPTNWTLTDGYPAVININNIEANATVDFMAVKVGDVNDSWDGLMNGADERGASTLIINANDATLSAGQEYTVEFTANDFAALGYQFTLNFNNLEVKEIAGNAENFGVFNNAITTSWAGEKVGDQLFAITFKATADVQISEALTLTNNITTAEAYNANGEVMNVELEFNKAANGFALYQNTPNPIANGSTTIGFDLPTAAAATVTVRDVTGKVVAVTNGDFVKGYNTLEINNLNASGVLTYTLESAGFTATRKLVVL